MATSYPSSKTHRSSFYIPKNPLLLYGYYQQCKFKIILGTKPKNCQTNQIISNNKVKEISQQTTKRNDFFKKNFF